MHILQLNFERGWRGGERQTLLSMQEFRRAGHDVALLARQNGELAQSAQADGFTVHACANVLGLCWFLLSRGRRFDILHAQTANTMTWLALLKLWLRRPIVFTRRTAFGLGKWARKAAWKWRCADALVAISEAAAVEPRRLGLEVVVIRSAVAAKTLDLTHAQAFAARFGLDGKRVLATAAALTGEKDPCTLIRAVHGLRQQRDDFVLVHLGPGGDAEHAARGLVQELGLEKHYLFAGFQERIEDLYHVMDLFVLSSRQEALGTSVLDAFLYKVPVVSTNAGGLKESLANGRGLLCEVGDYQAMSTAMARVLDDAALREGLIDKAQAYVVLEHDPERMAQRYLAEYQRLVAKV
ncbi:MAG: glycosyltransferase family 1 protein [Candidimonas sp.]|nr:MAG: glycosyltransferase family 1 protein [Candidimonas sp.]TAM23848.1 MAG: glycosyltransferase family 1 protein [Candidimonas sp.]